GMQLIDALPHTRERDESELALRVLLGTAWLALKGWPAPEVWTSLHPALALAKSRGCNDALVPIYWGLSVNVGAQGRVAEALPWARQMLDSAKVSGDAALLVTGHMCTCNYSFWMGRLVECLEHRDALLALYDETKHGHLVELLNEDPKAQAGVFASLATWMLGYPDRAVCMLNESVAHAHRIGHPFGLGWALSQGSDVFCYRCDTEEVRKRLDECDRLGRDNSLPVLWAVMAPGRYGMGFVREGKAAKGIAALKETLAVWDASGGKVWSPYGKAVLAEAMAMLGDIDDALQLIDEQIEQIERPGWEERVHYAEILRLKGWMLTLKDDLKGAEQNYLASLDWAREQQAKSWELRTSTSLARLWREQGKRKEAHDLLAPVYNWFTEGFDTKDLREAKALLEELAA
ncbi:MAG: hypothetical protein JSW48_11610, partial [Betaproteobacteria bacterium]